jgi:hypothetical protein
MANARAILALTCCALAGTAAEASAPEDTQLVSAVMQGRYRSGFVSAQQCWLYVHPHYGRYCVKPLKSEWVSSADGRWLYLLTAGVPSMRTQVSMRCPFMPCRAWSAPTPWRQAATAHHATWPRPTR